MRAVPIPVNASESAPASRAFQYVTWWESLPLLAEVRMWAAVAFFVRDVLSRHVGKAVLRWIGGWLLPSFSVRCFSDADRRIDVGGHLVVARLDQTASQNKVFGIFFVDTAAGSCCAAVETAFSRMRKAGAPSVHRVATLGRMAYLGLVRFGLQLVSEASQGASRETLWPFWCSRRLCQTRSHQPWSLVGS